MKTTPGLALATAVLLLSGPATAQQDHAHSHGAPERLGTVDFPNSCRPEVAATFSRAMALLHSFGYEEARKAFQQVADNDPRCGIAHWGIAMSYYHPIWSPPTPEELAAGRAAAEKATAVGAQTDRERGYIGAVAAYYREPEPGARAQAFRRAMEELSARCPADDEAAIFHALALLGTAPPSDTTFANQKRAAEVLNRLLPRHPDHPGIAHYVIHSFDYPPLAKDALPAARAYAKIAPSSPHALHMPSHIFTRLGLWPESIASNIDSAEAARRLVATTHPGATAFDALHALDYLEYAYLQVADEARARAVLAETAQAKTFNDPTFAAAYAVTAVPARWALERRDWKAAAALELTKVDLPWPRFRYVPATTLFAQAVGAARTGDLDRARQAVAKLGELQKDLARSPVPGPYDWAGNVESMRLAAAGLLARSEGRGEEALRLLRSAAELDERTGKHPVTPGPILPPRELLADLLLETSRPAEALVEYEAALRESPKRFNSLAGAARAADAAGQPGRAADLYAELLGMAVPNAQRPELGDARRYVASRK